MKLFGIGLSKTGTTSLANALTILGYRVRDNPGIERYAPGDLSCLDASVLEANDALTDTPIPSYYRELDARYPGSRFVLTVRGIDGWLKSCRKHFTQLLADRQNEAHRCLFMDLYGCTVFDEAKFRAGYERFAAGVREHFRDRPSDLLVMDIVGGDGWEKLCSFLGKPVPDLPFPKSNVTRVRWIEVQDLVGVVREAGAGLREIHEALDQGPMGAHRAWRVPRQVVRKVIYRLRGGRAGALSRAKRRALRAMEGRLRAMTPEIPVVGAQSASRVGHDERRRWNHAWLVAPGGYPSAPGARASGLAVSLALVEDGRPIYGVVYAPATDTVYYARAGGGGYKRVGGHEPTRLEVGNALGGGAGGPPRGAGRVAGSAPGSWLDGQDPALALCRLAEGHEAGAVSLRHAWEWDTAAAQLVLREAGRRALRCGTQDEVRYLKEDFRTDCLTVS